jgi:exosortase/archaeosortase family protein
VRLGAPLAWLGVILLAHAGVPGPVGLLTPLTGFLASVVQTLLAWNGVAALRHDAVLYMPGGFAYEVAAGCTGLLPAAVVAVAIVASPATGTAKRRGLAVTVPFLLGVNLLRLVHLFYLGVYAPRLFARAHGFLWEGAMVLVSFGTWLAWSAWAARHARTAGGLILQAEGAGASPLRGGG